jgi:hypothetical protein
MRRVLILAATAALIIGAIPSVAGAARVTRQSDEGLLLNCLIASEEEGTLYMSAQVSSEYGGYAALYWWEPGAEPFQSPPTLISGENSVIGTVAGSSLDATLELYTYIEADPEDPESSPYGEPAGQATVSATFETDGDPVAYSDESSGSNAKFRYDVVSQPLAATGTIQLPMATYDDLSQCEAARQQVSMFQTNPNTRIQRLEGIGLSCEWASDDRTVVLFASTEQSGQAYAEIFVSDASGYHAGFGEASLGTDAFAASWDLEDISGEFEGEDESEVAPAAIGGELSGRATAAASLSATGEGDRVIDRSHGEMFKFTYEVYAVSGELSLTTPAGTVTLAMDEACSANTAKVHMRFSSPSGKGGPPLRNDLPANAAPIQIGDAVSVRVAGAAPEAEAPCRIFEEEIGEEVDVPMGHTGWWTFTGTGGDVTIDTAGSTFDTVVGVYVLDGEELVQVGCVDDVTFGVEESTAQAVITIGTDADVTYYVQAGGFGSSTGQLELSVQ